ncbi:MAG TPA: WYL domain-containing protein, partial [Thermoleophilaceae bacterium]
RPENFHLSAIAFTDEELASLQFALTLLDGEFAYAEPLRLALQQISWGRPSPLRSPDQRTLALGITGSAGGHDLGQRLAKIETAIFRQKTITFDYYTMERDDLGARKVDPYHLLYRGGQFYLIGYSHEREDVRVFRVSRIRGKVGYSSKAEHDFNRPDEFDPRLYATRTDWQLGDPVGRASIWLSDRIDWLALRHFGHAGEVRRTDDGVVFETDYADPRQMVSWVLGLGEQARILEPPELVEEAARRIERVVEAHSGAFEQAAAAPRRSRRPEVDDTEGRGESPIRPERFARLVTLAGILIETAREGRKLELVELCQSLQVTEQELRQDIDVLNVVNFGGGSYVLYAEVQGDTIEVDPEPYGDNFARPARLLPLEAKALVAAIDLIGEHLPEGSLASARQKIVNALGQDPAQEGLQITTAKGDDSEIARVASGAVLARRLLKIEYYKENEDEFTERTVEPYKLANGQEGWYLHCWDLDRDGPRSYRLDRIREVSVLDEEFEPREGVEPDVHGWLATGEVPSASTARIWISPDRARWAQEDRRVVEELRDGAVIAERTFASHQWLSREILKEAGDAVVLEPEDARQAVLDAAEALAGLVKR